MSAIVRKSKDKLHTHTHTHTLSPPNKKCSPTLYNCQSSKMASRPDNNCIPSNIIWIIAEWLQISDLQMVKIMLGVFLVRIPQKSWGTASLEESWPFQLLAVWCCWMINPSAEPGNLEVCITLPFFFFVWSEDHKTKRVLEGFCSLSCCPQFL